jgi:hypothetical protein
MGTHVRPDLDECERLYASAPLPSTADPGLVSWRITRNGVDLKMSSISDTFRGLTIHKAQGSSLDRVSVDLRKTFACGEYSRASLDSVLR